MQTHDMVREPLSGDGNFPKIEPRCDQAASDDYQHPENRRDDYDSPQGWLGLNRAFECHGEENEQCPEQTNSCPSTEAASNKQSVHHTQRAPGNLL